MAAKYLEVFQDSMETMFGAQLAPLVAMGTMNSAITFEPVGSNSTQGTGAITYNVHRMIRGKAVDTPAITGSAGTDLVNMLNTAQSVSFDTIETARAAERSILFKVAPGEKFDFGDAEGFERVISSRVKSRLIEGEEKAVASLVASAGAVESTLDLTDAQVVADTIDAMVLTIQEISDEFKHYSDGVVVLIHPALARVFGKLEGQAYREGTNTFPEGKGVGFRYQGIDYIVNPLFNSIETTAGNVLGAIVMDKEAYANAGLNTGVTEFDQELLGDRLVGHKYSELDIVVDPSRIKIYDIARARTALVNA